MPNNRASLVVFDLNGVRPFLAAVVCPAQIACQDVLWPLEPLKANDRRCACFRLPAFNTAPGERIDLFSCSRSLCSFRAFVLGDALPGIGHGTVELAWMQAAHDPPGAAAQHHGFLALAKARAVWPLADDVVNSVRGDRRYCPYPPVTNAITLLRDDVGDQQDGPLVVRAGPRSDFFE